MSRAIIASLGLFKDTGGPVRTISQFKRALNADLFSFISSRNAKHREPANIGEQFIISSRLPVLNAFTYTPASRLSAISRVMGEATIVSVHSFYRFHAPQVAELAQKFGVPYWHVPHGILDPYVYGSKRLRRKVFLKLGGKRFLENSACTVFATNREREKAENIFGDLRGEIVHWPVDPVTEVMSAMNRTAFRKSWNIPENARILLYFGRIHSMKRPLETIQVLAGMKHPNLYLVILGPEDGVSATDCLDEGKRLGFKNLRVLPPVYGNKKISYLQACDAYISLSHRENFNHSAAESLAAGLPLILSEGNDLLHDMKGKGFTWTVRNTEKKSAAEAIESFLSRSDEELSEMSRLGREWVSRNLSFDIFQRRLKELEKTYGRH